MNDKQKVLVFGEVLFDCFSAGEQVLGGAPFNVAWHLQALGHQPQFISRVGEDELGEEIKAAMTLWGMNKTALQIDPIHPTGQVQINLINGEPQYTITPDCAYDFIAADEFSNLPETGILYHGSLGLRNKVSRNAFMQLARKPELSIFLDVNLRSPWWQKEQLHEWIKQARWVKLNLDELQKLGYCSKDIKQEMSNFQTQYQLDLLIVTRGEAGAIVRSDDGAFNTLTPEPVTDIVDTVGAGDAFSAVFIHGLVSGWSVNHTLEIAQQFASQVVGLRGATSTDPAFYQDFIN